MRALLLCGLLVVAGACPAAAAERPAPGPLPVSADRDRDKVFDDLEGRLAHTRDDARVRVIVTLVGSASEARVERLQRAVGRLAVSRRYRIVDAFAGAATKGQVRALARRSDVVQVEEDSVVRALNESAQSSFGVTKARLDVPELDGNADGSVATYSKDDLVTAVLDTGIDARHADLDEGKVIAFKDFVNGLTAPYDDDPDGHGTHAAGIVAAEGDGLLSGANKGVAPGAALVGVKVLDATGSGRESEVIAGIDWVVQNRATYGIEAINLSLGAEGCSDGTEADSRAVNRAHDAGLVVAVAAGNEGPGTCTVGSPGAAAKALTVGAMADMGEQGFHQAYFSSRGKTADGRIKPDVSAPGVGITSAKANTLDGYATYDGTSMATPFVAGVALLMRDATPSLTSQQVKDKIAETAVDWGRGGDNRTAGSSGPDIDYGAGRLDAYAALASAGAPLTSPPPMPGHQLLQGSLSGKGDADVYSIQVADTRFPIAATLIISGLTGGTSDSTNFDLELRDPSGNLVDTSRFTTRQEEVYFSPTTAGIYSLRVVSANGSGSYFADVSAGLDRDTTPPETTIDSGPASATNDRTPTFTFSASEGGSRFECRVDDGTFAACSSPHTAPALGDGPHTFDVRATDEGGNVGEPARRSFRVDTVAPSVTLTTPASGSRTSDATPRLAGAAGTATGDSTTVTARIYSGTSAAGSPVRTLSATRSGNAWALDVPSALPDGTYTAQASQSDTAGNTGTSGGSTFTVDAPEPPTPRSSDSPPAAASPPPLNAFLLPALAELRSSLSRGLSSPVSCAGPCRVETAAFLSRRAARRVGIAARSRYVRVARGTRRLTRAGKARVRARFTRRARRRLGRARRVRLLVRTTVRPAGGIRTVSRRRLTLARGIRAKLTRRMPVSIGCSTPCRASARLVVGRRTTLGRGRTRLARAGARRLVVRLNRGGRRRVRSSRRLALRLIVKVSDGRGQATRLSQRISLRR